MYTLNIIDSIRKKAIRLVKETSLEDLNRIPEGFNNSMAWNFGHLIVSGYSLVFKVTGADTAFVIPLQDKYRKGTKPSAPTTQEELEELILLSDTFTQAVKDALDKKNLKRSLRILLTRLGCRLPRLMKCWQRWPRTIRHISRS